MYGVEETGDVTALFDLKSLERDEVGETGESPYLLTIFKYQTQFDIQKKFLNFSNNFKLR